MNLFALLDQAARRFPDRGAMYHGEHRLCTWRELRERSLRPASSIRDHCPAGAQIAITSENRPEIIELLFGIWAAECAAVPVNYKLHSREMVQIIEDAGVAQVSPRRRSQWSSWRRATARSKPWAHKAICGG